MLRRKTFRTFAVSKDKGFEFYRKIIEHAHLIYSCHNPPGDESIIFAYQEQKLAKYNKFNTLIIPLNNKH